MTIEKKHGDIRCENCNKLLMKGNILKVEIKCPRCGIIQQIAQAKNRNTSAGSRNVWRQL